MAHSKLQRWVDLLAALLRRNYPASFDQLAAEVPGYGGRQPRTSALRRMFERDKDELRSFGIPIETRDIGDGELGYALARTDFYLPYLTLMRDGRRAKAPTTPKYGYRSLPSLAFEPDELAAIALAGQRVQALGVGSLITDVSSALRKLGHDLPLDGSAAEDGTHLALEAPPDGAMFDLLSQALKNRKRVTFTYHSMGRDVSAARVVAPYGLFFLGRHWYLAALPEGEEHVKNFRLSRMSGLSVNPAQPGTPDYQMPKGWKLREHARSRQAWELGQGDVTEALVRVLRRGGTAAAFARLGRPVSGEPELRVFQVRRLDAFVRWLMGFGGAVMPVSPDDLVAQYRRTIGETLGLYEVGP